MTALKPLLDAVGLERDLDRHSLTLDETSYARELCAALRRLSRAEARTRMVFHDSAEGMRRFREMTTETAGFYNTVGFNDDTRAFPSIPRATTLRAGSTAHFSRVWSRNIACGRMRRTSLRGTLPMVSPRRRTGSENSHHANGRKA